MIAPLLLLVAGLLLLCVNSCWRMVGDRIVFDVRSLHGKGRIYEPIGLLIQAALWLGAGISWIRWPESNMAFGLLVAVVACGCALLGFTVLVSIGGLKNLMIRLFFSVVIGLTCVFFMIAQPSRHSDRATAVTFLSAMFASVVMVILTTPHPWLGSIAVILLFDILWCSTVNSQEILK